MDAIKPGLPESRLKIIGTRIWNFCIKTVPLLKLAEKTRRRLGVPDKEEVVIFLSEILEEDFGPSKQSPF